MYSLVVCRKKHLNQKKLNNIDELVLSFEGISRRSHLKKEDFEFFQDLSQETNIPLVCDFDILVCESDFKYRTDLLQTFDLKSFKALRVQDFGIVQWAFENTDLPLQLNLETGHHNFDAIQTWIDYLGERLDKIILSYELSLEILNEFTEKIAQQKIDVEVLGLGPILLFYSPRKLLSRYDEVEKNDESLKMVANSLESPHSGFKLVENDQGTFMYHLKDLCLVDLLHSPNEKFSLHENLSFRIEDNGEFQFPFDEFIQENIDSFSGKTTIGYARVNKSDVLFKKLKNKNLIKDESKFFGEVVFAKKGDFLAISTSGEIDIRLGSKIELISPDGLVKEFVLERLRDASFKNLEGSGDHKLVLLDYLKKMTPRTLVNITLKL